MLSDEKMDRKIREHVKEHPVILPEDYQAMVQEQIKKCCEGEMHMNKKNREKETRLQQLALYYALEFVVLVACVLE